MADYSEQTASAPNEAENTGSDHNPTGESSSTSSLLYPVDRLINDNNTTAHSTDGETGETSDNTNLALRCQFCKRHVQCIDDKITTLQIYGDSSQADNPSHSIQTLNCSRCNHKTIGVKLCNRWWQLDDALKSWSQRHDGLHQVTTYGERIVLFLLNSVIYPQQDFEESCDIVTKPHHPYDHAKLLWSNNSAIGFYSYKQQGAALNDHVGLLCTWSLPVLDGLYVRKEHRGQDHGLQVLQDFIAMYPDGPIGVAQPCSKPFLKVCHKYLKKHPEDRSRLWLCNPPGSEHNRISLWRHSKKLFKQMDKTSTEAVVPTTTLGTTTSPMSTLASPNASSCPSTSLVDTHVASVTESCQHARDAEASALHVDNDVGTGPQGEACSVSRQDNVQSKGQEDVEGVIVSSASSCQSSCKDEHQLGVPCQGCSSKSDECTNGGTNTSFEIKDDSFHADSSEAIANFSEEASHADEAYKKVGERSDLELQNIASSSSAMFEGEDTHSSSHEAETTAIDLSAKKVNEHRSNAEVDKSQDEAAKREVDSSMICADDDRSVGGGGDNHEVCVNCNSEDTERQAGAGNGDLLKHLLSKSKLSSQISTTEPAQNSDALIKTESKPNIDDIYSSHSCKLTSVTESKPVVKVKDEHSSNDGQSGMDIKSDVEDTGGTTHVEPIEGASIESRRDCTNVVFSDGHIRQLLTKDDNECTSPVVPERPTRPHPVQIIHNPLAGEERGETSESQNKEAQSILPRLLTGYQVDNPPAMIAGSDSDSQPSVDVQLPSSHEQGSPSADSMTGRRRPFRVSDYSSWFTNENYNILSRQQQGQKRRSDNDNRNSETGAIMRSWKRNRRTGTLSERERLRHPSWSIWNPVQNEDPISSNQQGLSSDANNRNTVTVRDLLQQQRQRDVVEPSSTLPNVINTSTYTPTSTTFVYSNSLGQQPPQPPHIAPQRFLGPPVTSYNAFQSQQETKTNEAIGHFHTFRWTRPRKVYARRGTRHPSAPARSSTPDSSFDDIRPTAPFTVIADEQSTRAEVLGQPAQTQDKFTSTRGLFTQSSLDSQDIAGSSMTVTESTQSRDLNPPPPQATSPNASTSSESDTRNVGEGCGSIIKQLLLREPSLHVPKPETAHRQPCVYESRVSQSQSTEEDQQRNILREEGEISSHQRGDQEDEDEEEEDLDNKAALRMQLGINVGVSVGTPVNYRNTQTSSYTCEHCDIVFMDSVMYVLHMGCHGRRSAFECNRCGMVCRDKYEFAIHFIQGEHNKD